MKHKIETCCGEYIQYCLNKHVTEIKDKLRKSGYTVSRGKIGILTVSGPQATVCSGEDDPLVAALLSHTQTNAELTTDFKILT